ncbi:MAG: MGMT family protein [Actinomycetia bacterium]|nr:MGMT family protein [Actinomycetes bacterium]
MAADALPTPFAEEVLDMVATIPAGRVMAYSDVASTLGRGGARQVGQALARFGSGVPWWRVLRADGSCADVHRDEQVSRLRAEGVPMVSTRVDMDAARWRP